MLNIFIHWSLYWVILNKIYSLSNTFEFILYSEWFIYPWPVIPSDSNLPFCKANLNEHLNMFYCYWLCGYLLIYWGSFRPAYDHQVPWRWEWGQDIHLNKGQEWPQPGAEVWFGRGKWIFSWNELAEVGS